MKKIIAREGLVLIGFVASAIIVMMIWSENNIFSLYYVTLGYPCYLLIRFILWAVKTLREKE